MPSFCLRSRSRIALLLSIHCLLGKEIGWVLCSGATCPPSRCEMVKSGVTSELPSASTHRLHCRARALCPGSELHVRSLTPVLGHPTEMSPITTQHFLFRPSEGGEKSCKGRAGGKSHKGGTEKNELGKATSPQLWTLPTQPLPPQHQGRAAKRWGGLQPPSTPEEIQTLGCLNFYAGAQNRGSSEIFPG